jgi:glycogen debranching enzyme
MAPLLGLALLVSGERLRIGNFFLTAPNGVAIIRGNRGALVLDFGGDYVAGIAAPDDSYHRQLLTVNGKHVTLEWGRTGDSAVGRLSADEDATFTATPKQSWPDMHTDYVVAGDGLTANLAGNGIVSKPSVGGDPKTDQYRIEFDPAPTKVTSDAIELSVRPGSPSHFTISNGPAIPNDRIDRTLNRARDSYLARRPTAEGAWGDFLGAIADNMNNSRLYVSDQQFVAHTVSRGWAGGDPNAGPFFCWDSFFNGALACLDDPEIARATVKAILSWQTPEGLVPNFGHWGKNERSSTDRSQPPVGSLCVWKMQQRWPDTDFLKEVYPKLLTWHRWWLKARDGDHDGLLEWGSSKAGKQGALWETGWDDTPQYAESEMVGYNLDTDGVDLNSLYSMDAENLAYIADAVGDHATAKELRAEHLHMNKLINERLWNPELGIYCSRKWESKGGKFLTRLTPMNFYPLICGAASPEQAKKVLSVMTDPHLFWGQWILPTVPYTDPLWKHQGYWHGTVWAPVNFLVFQGLRRYADPTIIGEYAAKSVDLFMRNWTTRGWCGENFGSDNGMVNGDKHYTWGALMCLVGLESICFAEADGRVTLNGVQTESRTLRNVPIHGKRYTVETGPGWARLYLDDRLVLEAEGRVVSQHL